MYSDNVWNSGPFFPQSYDTNCEQFLETSECEPLPEDQAVKKMTIQIAKSESWISRLVSSLFRPVATSPLAVE